MTRTSKRKARKSRTAPKPKSTSHLKSGFAAFELPYFAHQQLDPTKYNNSVGLPVGKPGWAPAPVEIATATNGGWGDDADAPLEEDPDVSSDFEFSPTHSAKRSLSGSKDNNPYKRLRVEGGRPAVAKKVTADLDSDDELIVRMKNAKYLEKDIAQRLVDEGRVAYNPKTIGTRWARLRKALERRQDELLDAELTDWHDDDDDVLYEAICRADVIVAKAIADANDRKWRIVADQMKGLKPVVSFSQNACRSRFKDLQAGNAKPTPESIDDPDDETLRRIQSRRDKEQRIAEDRNLLSANSMSNLEGNGWTSKRRQYL